MYNSYMYKGHKIHFFWIFILGIILTLSACSNKPPETDEAKLISALQTMSDNELDQFFNEKAPNLLAGKIQNIKQANPQKPVLTCADSADGKSITLTRSDTSRSLPKYSCSSKNVIERICSNSGYNSRISEKCSNGCSNGKCTGQERVLGVFINPVPSDGTEASPEELNSILFDPTNSVKSFFDENSYGKIQMEGEIIEEPLSIENLEVNEEEGNFSVNYSQLLSNLDDQVNFRDFDIFLFFILREDACDGNSSSIGKVPYDSLEGRVNIGYAAFNARCMTDFSDIHSTSAILHEIGHILGLRHAAAWMPSADCADLTLDNLSEPCIVNSYGGGTVMGSGRGDLYIEQRKKLALSHVTTSQTIDENGDYWVYWWRDRDLATEYEELSIPVPDGHYSIEFRQNISPDIEQGVTVNFVPTNIDFLIDLLPDVYLPDLLLMGSRSQALTEENPQCTDELRNVSITVLSIEENRAQLQISLN